MKYLILVLLIFLTACNEQKENIMVEVNGEVLTEKEMNIFLPNAESGKQEFIQDWIRLTLLAQESDKLGITETPEIKEKIEIAGKNVKANALISQKLANLKISEDDLFNYYKLHKSEYITTYPEYKIQRIFCTDKNIIAKIRTEINNSSFTDAAKKYSEEEIGNSGGYIGWKSEENCKKELWEALISLKKYHYKTVKVDKGFYFIRYSQKREKKIDKKFEEVKDIIEKIVLQNKKKDIYAKLIKELKTKAEISISE